MIENNPKPHLFNTFFKNGRFTQTGTLVSVVALIVLIGSLTILGFGLASFGSSSHWWNVAHCVKHIPLHQAKNMLIIGSSIGASFLILTIALQIGRKKSQNTFLNQNLPIKFKINLDNRGNLAVHANQKDVENHPLKHLNQIAPLMITQEQKNMKCLNNQIYTPSFEVSFYLGEKKEQGEGSGLVAGYVTSLFSGLAQTGELNIEPVGESGLGIPCAVPNKKHTQEYTNLGILMGYCKGRYTTGICFDDLLFELMLGFSEEDLRKNQFDRLSQDAKNKVYKLYVEKRTIDNKENILFLIDLLSNDTIEKKDPSDAIQYLANNGYELQNFDNNVKTMIQAYLSENFDQFLEPAYTIACGMYAICNQRNQSWETIQKTGAPQLSHALQGSLNRQEIANALVAGVMLTKEDQNLLNIRVKWIQQWLQSESTTNEEVKDFLYFVTANTSLPLGTTQKQIEVVIEELENLGYPTASTCVRRLNLVLRETDNYNSFISNLKEGIKWFKRQAENQCGKYTQL